MIPLSAELKKRLARTRMTVLPEDYMVVRLPAGSKPVLSEWYRPATTRFAVFITGPKETSLIIARRKWLRMQNIFRKYKVSGPMKVVGFDKKLSMVVPGYMSTIGSVLVQSKISVVPISTLSSDHILVQKADLPRTVRLLRHFIEKCRE